MMKRNSDSNNNSRNDIYITLKSERNYYQGDVISGAVVLDLQSAKKTQSVKITLEGIALIHNKPTTIYTTTQVLMEPPENEKFIALEPHTHTYNFHLNAPSSKALPSTLEIPELMTVQYRLVAVQQVQFGLLDFTKVHPTAEKEVNILERIDVNEFPTNYNEMRDIALVGLEKKVRVAVDMLKCAAVKGATVPISITIQHVGVMVKDRAIRVRLFRNVFYQNTRLNMDGPELITSTNGDIMIIGPTEFTATTKLKLAIPSKICPTVDETGKTFKVEYLVNVIVNLNEESPHLKQRDEEIVVFDIPFTIGTFPHLDYCIDDDDDDDDDDEQEEEEKEKEDIKSNSSSSNKNSRDEATSNTNQNSDFTVKALDQVNIESTLDPVPPEIIEQRQEPLLEEYKPDQVPEQITPPAKQRTMTYESGVQLPEFIENDPILPEQMMDDNPETNESKPVLPQRDEQQQEPSLPQQVEEYPVALPQIKQQEEEEEEQVSLPIQVPSMYQEQKMTSENAATYLPTPSSSSRPSSPSPTYHIPHPLHGTNRSSSNTSLPLYNPGITNTSAPELPIEMGPRLEKRSSYLSMNNIPSSPSPPPIPPRNNPPRNASPAFNTKPPLPSRPSNNNNYSFGPSGMAPPYHHNGVYGGYNNNSTGHLPTVGMPMPMPSPNHSYPEPPLTMPQPQQHYYRHQ